MGGVDNRPKEDPIPMPPPPIVEIHSKATPALYILQGDPTNEGALQQLRDLNADISTSNNKANEQMGPKDDKIPVDQWHIPLEFFTPHWKDLLKNYAILVNARDNQEARKVITKATELIDIMIKRNHFPQDWHAPTADEYLGKLDQNRKLADEMLTKISASYTTAEQDFLNMKSKAADLDDSKKADVDKAEKHIAPKVASALQAKETAEKLVKKVYQTWNLEETVKALETMESACTTASEAATAVCVAIAEVSHTVSTKPSQGHMKYPWPTAQAADGSLIIGVRKMGLFATQACVETQEEDGRVIRRLQSASDTGLLEVEQYKKLEGFKNLAEGQNKWTYKHREDFVKLHWVTKSQTKLRNTAARNKKPNADCCVEFTNGKIEILTLSSFRKVLGETSAMIKVKEVCKRDGILPPNEAGCVSEYFDPSKLEKDPAKRRQMEEEQATKTAENPRSEHKPDLRKQDPLKSARGGDSTFEDRLARLEAKVDGLERLLNKVSHMDEKLDKLLKSMK